MSAENISLNENSAYIGTSVTFKGDLIASDTVIVEGTVEGNVTAGSVLVGTNGAISDDTVNQFFSALSGVPRVLVLTIHLPPRYTYTADNNAKLASLPAQFPNVSVLYWDGLANQCPGDCIYGDGFHLKQDGQNFYTQLIADQLGI